MNLEKKAHDRVLRKELWYCMKNLGVADKHVRVVQDMYEDSMTAMRWAMGMMDRFKVEVRLYQG